MRVDSREEAIEKVRSGEVLGAMVIPADAAERLRSTLGLGGGDPPQIEVYYNASDPLKKQLVQNTIQSRLAEANDRALRRRAARGGRLHRRDRHRRGGRAAAGREHRHPRPAPLAGDHRGRGAEPPEGRARARRADAGRPLRPPGRRQPRRLQADPGHDRVARRRQADQRQRRHDDAERLLRGCGGDRLADVRRPAAGRRAACPRARAARVRPARPRPRLAHGAAVGEGRARGAVRARRLAC